MRHCKQNAELQEFEDKITKENRILLVQFLTEHYNGNYRQDKMRNDPQIEVESEKQTGFHALGQLPSGKLYHPSPVALKGELFNYRGECNSRYHKSESDFHSRVDPWARWSVRQELKAATSA